MFRIIHYLFIKVYTTSGKGHLDHRRVVLLINNVGNPGVSNLHVPEGHCTRRRCFFVFDFLSRFLIRAAEQSI